ncbi:hypothetical protein CLU79DRAFT_460568 [Phycomyces nitens]|nr:hypothetical protein CLU79DRAFT_460568 [Phycomyces nitens]
MISQCAFQEHSSYIIPSGPYTLTDTQWNAAVLESSKKYEKHDKKTENPCQKVQYGQPKLVIRHYSMRGSQVLKSSVINTRPQKYICSRCIYTTNSNYNYKRHLETHSVNPSRHSCEMCPKTYSNRDNLQRHVKNDH